MSTSTATASTPFPEPRPGRLRRFSQLRAYTQNLNLSSTSGHRARHSISHRVSWFSPNSPSHVGSSSACPDSPALSRYTSAPDPRSQESAIDSQPSSAGSTGSTPPNELNQTPNDMARLRNSTSAPGRPTRSQGRTATPEAPTSAPAPVPAPTSAPVQAISDLPVTPGVMNEPEETTSANGPSTPATDQKATIRFFPYQDTYQSSRPSLPFVPISRTLPSGSCSIRVGRYSERDAVANPNPLEPSEAPVGFKSKVVSRKHCEFMYANGQWHVKDVGSSSGTFLNHMRLSQPNMVSRLYAIKDGDIVQLGIDFRGGEEMIFRCVRIRIECNRSWQQKPNEFNKNTESLIKNLGKGEKTDYSGCRECSICLGSVLRPYQCLFMAACAHVWHYKCISRLLHSPDYPMFQCPNCRAYTDLSAEVDDTNDVEEAAEEKELPAAISENMDSPSEQQSSNVQDESGLQEDVIIEESDLIDVMDNLQTRDALALDVDTEDSGRSSHEGLARSATVNIPGWQPTLPVGVPQRRPLNTSDRLEISDDNPMTPRNDWGPLAFDGRAGMS
ncbi:Zinc finger RING-type [Penicillium taxi]|uniref:Zinc finger RING-type n=1 Tax=Penicillium taxi TaxID=168475 RepID=UPI002545A0D7|nr:Zinc finger RING-type [Penicillium taxi]KAJ5894247.1 Zinc finger RING-type [Penicillium taxi]